MNWLNGRNRSNNYVTALIHTTRNIVESVALSIVIKISYMLSIQSQRRLIYTLLDDMTKRMLLSRSSNSSDTASAEDISESSVSPVIATQVNDLDESTSRTYQYQRMNDEIVDGPNQMMVPSSEEPVELIVAQSTSESEEARSMLTTSSEEIQEVSPVSTRLVDGRIMINDFAIGPPSDQPTENDDQSINDELIDGPNQQLTTEEQVQLIVAQSTSEFGEARYVSITNNEESPGASPTSTARLIDTPSYESEEETSDINNQRNAMIHDFAFGSSDQSIASEVSLEVLDAFPVVATLVSNSTESNQSFVTYDGIECFALPNYSSRTTTGYFMIARVGEI